MTTLILPIAFAAGALAFVLTVISTIGDGLSTRMQLLRFGSGFVMAACIATYFFTTADTEPFRQAVKTAPRLEKLFPPTPVITAFLLYFGICGIGIFLLRFTPWHLPKPRSLKEWFLRGQGIYAPDIDRSLIRKWWLAIFLIWIVGGIVFFSAIAISGGF